MDRRIKKILVIISLILIGLGLFLNFRTFEVVTDFKRIITTEATVPTSLPVSYIPTVEVIDDNRLIIGVIDVNLEIGTEQRFLDFGGWIVKSNQDGLPLAIAIHRFGLDSVTTGNRIHQTLIHVNELKIGDSVTMDWEGKEYLYKVKTINIDTNNPPVKENELLLYTCEYWSSPERVFVLLEKVI